MPVFKEMYRIRQDLNNLKNKLKELQINCDKNCDQRTAQQVEETIEAISEAHLKLEILENLKDRFHY